VPGPPLRFEVAAGAVLTQNTAWLNAEAALKRLAAEGLLGAPASLLAWPPRRLAALIRPSGYYNQKARKLRALAAYLAGMRGRSPTREELLTLWGIGPETADSILLYAWHLPVPVADAYTRRLFHRLGWTGEQAGYEELASLCAAGLSAAGLPAAPAAGRPESRPFDGPGSSGFAGLRPRQASFARPGPHLDSEKRFLLASCIASNYGGITCLGKVQRPSGIVRASSAGCGTRW
jgi:hypothetical protein